MCIRDRLLAIGDRVLEGMTTDSLVKLLVGPQGSAITLTCRRSALPQAVAAGVSGAGKTLYILRTTYYIMYYVLTFQQTERGCTQQAPSFEASC